MAELALAILSPFISPLIEKMASVDVRDFFKRHELDQGQLQKLKVTLNTVAKVVADAEEKQFTDPRVRAWLDDLKDAAFRADDFLDEVAYEVLKLKIESGGAQTSADAEVHTQTCTGQVRKFLTCFNLCRKEMNMGEMEPRFKEIQETLDYLVQQMGPLGLEKENSTGKGKSLKLDASPPTTSLVDASDVYGRDGDKERLVELLRSGDGNGKNVGAVLIVGMGGLGKTTLAQLVYKDDRVQQCFDVRAWVYVPKELEAFCVARDIMKVVGLGGGIDNMTADQMHCELEKKLSGNKVLLVLDDVWCATQPEWDSLMKPFMSVKQGSKIIVTTRHSSVAGVMSSVTIHPLAELSEENCWLLFAKHAFDGKSWHEYPDLEKIGWEMVKKCNGLPLAAKAVGGVLRRERRVGRWRNVLNSNMWDLPNNEILPALRLSYSYLPSSLKQCFAYCAIFPKNYRFKKEELVLLWIAEDFIVASGTEENMEIGERYFEDLVSRFFLQQQRNFLGETIFTMHDLMNDLATLVSREFCSSLEGINLLKASQRTRYASCLLTQTHFEMDRDTFILDSPHSLRTLIFWGYWLSPLSVDNEAWWNFLLALKSLRVLCLSDGVRLLELPDSIGILKHLRFLSLLDQSNIKQLPESICNLYNMQILILKGCESLTKLPNDMRKLVNLVLLDIRGTTLHEMPPHMGELTKLQKLSGDFVVGEQKQRGSNSSINELGKLCNLRGSLSVCGLQNVVDVRDVKEANLYVEDLWLQWGDEEDNDNWSLHQLKVLEKLVPHKDLKNLSISGYGGERFVDWVGHSSFSCMESLKLDRCKIRSLPPLCQLACLEKLSIHDCSRITSIGSELHAMNKLKYLSFYNMREWCEWISDGDDSDTNFPLLLELSVTYCPKLKKALPGHLPSVAKIRIDSCEQLEMECFQFECFPKLEVLVIRGCPKLVSLTIKSCPEIESFPTTLQVNLGGSNTKLRELTVLNCKKLFSRRHEWGLEMLPSLISLDIGGCNEVVEESFPEKMLLPSTLTSLTIQNFPYLKSLNYEGLQYLTSLRDLRVWGCPKLQSLLLPNQNQKLPSSLSSLSILGCPLLKGRCEPVKGEDWPKIAHIPTINFEGFSFSSFSFIEVSSLRKSNGKVVCCHFSTDGKLLASAGHDKKVVIWNMETLQTDSTPEEHTHIITDVRFRPNSTQLVTSSFDSSVRLWDAAEPICCLQAYTGHTSHVMSVDFHPKKTDLFCSCDGNNEIRFWNINQYSPTRISKGGSAQVRFQPRIGQLLAAAADSVVSIFDVEADRQTLSLQGHSSEVHSVCWDVNGDYLASVSQDSVRVWSMATGECIHELNSSGNKFHSCVFHPIYSVVLVIGGYQSLELWNMAENKCMTIAGHERVISALAQSPVTGMVASASHDKCVKIWNQ